MKKIIMTIDNLGNLISDSGVTIWCGFEGNYAYTELKEQEKDNKANPLLIAKLIEQGFEQEDIVKLREAGIL